MTREIKFRGWNTVQKVMFSAETMAADQLTLLPTGSFINVHGGSTRLSEIYPADKFIPLQYTGLKDKNGVEIYEGDIVSTESETMQIVYHHSGFHLAWLDGGISAPLHPFLITVTGVGVKVIGNIYSNKELLKGKG